MTLVNLTFLNASNGMFWYAIDKLKAGDLDWSSCTVFVRAHLVDLVLRELPEAQVREATRSKAIATILRSRLRRKTAFHLVTFTSHPLPFLLNQTIAFYDDYPFKGRLGGLKRMLFTLAARTSRCRVGVINRSRALPFLRACGIPESRIFFDSAFPLVAADDNVPRSATPADPIRIGLVGTDSRKKNYSSIFGTILALKAHSKVRFRLYGAENAYTAELQRDFTDVELDIVSSDAVSMPEFFGGIDYLISASVEEGYGRPMGLAVKLGVPLFLLRSPVFLEFFGGHAEFFDDVTGMLRHLIESRPPAVAARLMDFAPEASRSGFFA